MNRDIQGEAGRVGLGALVMLLPTVFAQGIGLILAPVYTQVMEPADYGIVGLVSVTRPVIAMAMGCGLHQALTRLYFRCQNAEERSELYSSVILFLLVFAAFSNGLLQLCGTVGAFSFVKTAPFWPYLSLTVTAASVWVFVNLPLNWFMVQEQRRRAALYSILVSALTISVTLYFVVLRRRGALGHLEAQVVAGSVAAVGAVLFMLRQVGVRPRLHSLVRALKFGLPLVPHNLGTWISGASDRWVLDQLVPAAALGRYSLGHSFSSPAAMFNRALQQSIGPVINRRLTNDQDSRAAEQLGTLAVAALGWGALGVAVVGQDLVVWITPSSYHAAAAVVPWLAFAALGRGVSVLFNRGTLFAERTGRVSIITTIATGLSIVAMVVLVPNYGAVSAAWSRAAGSTLLVFLTLLIVPRSVIRWRYRRCFALLGLYGLVFFLTDLLGPVMDQPSLLISLVRLSVALLSLPFALAITGTASLTRQRKLLSELATRLRRRRSS